ncbi:MAG: YoaK family protein [Acidimicrobiia bacterium]
MSAPGEPVAPFAGRPSVVMTLAAVAGCLDAVCLARLTGTFVAFQTGNTVLVGLGVGQGRLSQAAPPAVAVLAYLFGSALAPEVVGLGTPAPARAVRRLLAVATSLLLVDVVIVLVAVGLADDSPRPHGAWRYVCIAVAAVAMAFQTPVVRRVRGIPVASTFSSGMLTRLGQSIGGLRSPTMRPHELVVVRVLGGTILAFVVGAVVGGLLVEEIGNGAIVAPLLGLLTAAALVARDDHDAG